MRFLVCKKQKGEGCDYTIGCGMVYEIIEAVDSEAAIEKIVWPYGHDEISALEGEFALEEILLVGPAVIKTVDVEGIAALIKKQRQLERALREKEDELTEYRRLEEKYG